MKKTHYLFLLLFLIPFFGKAQNWQPLGPDDFNQLSAGEYLNKFQITVIDGNPYVAYVYGDDKYSVGKFRLQKYANNKWQTAIDGSFSVDKTDEATTSLNGATPYVAYTNQTNYKLTVKKLVGNQWEAVGPENFSDNKARTITLGFNEAVPYVMYSDMSSNNVIVKSYNGLNWETVGDPEITHFSWVIAPRIAFGGGVPYIIYQDNNNNSQVKIKKFNNVNRTWELVGNLNVSNVKTYSIAVDGGDPYVAYGTYGGLIVQKFDGLNWAIVGNTSVNNSEVKGFEISFLESVPYVIYNEKKYNGKTVLSKLKADESGWETIGDIGVLSPSQDGSSSGGDPLAIAFINAKPHVAYLASGAAGNGLMKKFDDPDWKTLGASGFSTGKAAEISIAADLVSPYVAYKDGANGDKLTVKKHNGSTWKTVGNEGFSVGRVESISIELDGIIPYVAYQDRSDNKLYVQSFNGEEWSPLGIGAVSEGDVMNSHIAINNSTIYIAYTDYINRGKVIVKKFNQLSNAWEQVGGMQSDESSNSPKIVFNDDVPYIAYVDSYYNLKVAKYSNNTWQPAGNLSINAMDFDFKINNGSMYVVYAENENSGRAIVKKYNTISQNWEKLGDLGTEKYSMRSKLTFINDVPYVGYHNSSNGKVNVKAYNGNTWESIGEKDLSAGKVNSLGIVSNGSTLFIAYTAGGAYAKRFTFSTPTVAINPTVYVTEIGAGTKDGSSWSNAAADLQKAMQNSTANVYVASGTYKPVYPAQTDFSTAYTPNPGNRDNAFVLVKDVKVYGGFNATTPEASPELRDVSTTSANKSILSGDFLGDDPNEIDITQPQTTFDDNIYHVVIAAGELGTAVLNGFTVSSGYAADKDSNATFESENGVTVNAVTAPYFSGGGILAVSSSPEMKNLILRNNFGFKGAAVATIENGDPKLTNLTINGNFGAAGVIYAHNTNPVLTNVAIIQNLSQAGGMFNRNSNPTLTNVTIAGNTFGNSVAGIFNIEGSNPIIRNSIINGITNDNSTPVISYSLIGGSEGSGSNWKTETGTDGGNNIDGDPKFRDMSVGDYSLQSGSPAINAGSNSFFASGETPDLSTINFDLAGKLRMNGVIDMGAYEYEGTLPVTLVNFTAKAEKNGAKLTWQTASEQNNASFLISRSTDGVSFKAIGNVNGKGNSNKVSNYSFVDYSPVAGTNYYRLEQKDTDGKINDLGVRAVEFKLANAEPTIYPNPTADLAKVKFTAGLFNTITLLDMNGRVLAKQSISTTQQEADFNLSSYKAGTYIISLSGLKETKSYKVVKM